MEEIWKTIWNHTKYEVSNFGRVRYKKTQRLLALCTLKSGYVRVHFDYVHRLVFEAFYRRLLPNEHCHHLNRMKNCNISTNLVAKDKRLHIAEHNTGREKTPE